jgi:gas vesicle structural protein
VKRTLTSTVPAAHPPHSPRRPSPPRRVIPAARPVNRVPARRKAARIVRRSDTSLLDVLDGLLKKGVVLNADIVLALADVDLIYLRLSALLCAADRVFERR